MYIETQWLSSMAATKVSSQAEFGNHRNGCLFQDIFANPFLLSHVIINVIRMSICVLLVI